MHCLKRKHYKWKSIFIKIIQNAVHNEKNRKQDKVPGFVLNYDFNTNNCEEPFLTIAYYSLLVMVKLIKH